MDRHLSIEDIEKYINNESDDVSLDWFQGALDHVMTCNYCKDRISNYIQIERICDDDGKMLAIGLEELAKMPDSPKKKSLLEKLFKGKKK